jgi:hypothetical protein
MDTCTLFRFICFWKSYITNFMKKNRPKMHNQQHWIIQWGTSVTHTHVELRHIQYSVIRNYCFLNLTIVWYSKKLKDATFQKLDVFPSSDERETYFVGSLKKELNSVTGGTQQSTCICCLLTIHHRQTHLKPNVQSLFDIIMIIFILLLCFPRKLKQH